MAAGRRGGYRDNGFEGLESNLGMVRKEIENSDGGYGEMRHRNGEYERVRSRARDGLDHRVRIRQKDLKEREEATGGYRSSSSVSDSGSSGGGSGKFVNPAKMVEREPGELSSDSSEGAIDAEVVVSEEIQSKNLDNGVEVSPVQIKRKFSPVVWDRDDRAVSRPAKSRHVSGTANLPPRPPMVKSHNQSPPSADANVQATDVSSKVYLRPDVLEVPAETCSTEPQKQLASNVGTSATDDYDDDYVPMRTVISSRWANEGDSPADEGEISDYEDTRASNRRSVSVSNEVRGSKSISPELGELDREGSTGTRGRSSESDERVRSSSRDRYSDSDDRDNYMEIDNGRKYVGSSVMYSDNESDDDTSLPKRSVNMLQACRSVEEFEWLNKIDEGTYGVVSRAKDKKTGEVVALKKVKMEKEREGFPLTALREMNILLSFDHPSIVNVKEVVMGGTRGRKRDDISQDDIFMVMEYMEHDLKAVLETKRQPYSQSEVKCLMLQLIGGIKYLHDNWVLHRDLKTSNLLLNNRGQLKICDFGMARQYGSPLKPYTQLVVTLWYRAPELLLGAKQYSTAVDMWSIGCIMAELLSKEPLFSGRTEIEQLKKIFEVLGTPNETIWPGCTKLPGFKVNFPSHRYNLRKKFPATSFIGSPVLSDAGFDLLSKLLIYDPEKRITAEAALNHPWFSEAPRPTSKKLMPTYPPLHAQDRRMRRVWKSPDPLEEQRRKELQGEMGNGGLFGL